jgi:hypothetical protein
MRCIEILLIWYGSSDEDVQETDDDIIEFQA